MSNLWLEHLNQKARGRKYEGPVLRYGAVWKDVWNNRYVSSLGAFAGDARNVIHHLLYSPCRSSFRCLGVFLEMVVSNTRKWLKILHVLFHHENLDLVAMDCCTILALAARGCRSGLDRYSM